MNITLRGASKGQEASLLSAADFYSRQLFHLNMWRNMTLSIVLTTKNKEPELQGIIGCCLPTTNGKNPRSFEIYLNKSELSGPLLYRTLAHEIVHARQMARNQLIFLEDKNISAIFEGKEYKRGYEYWTAPWEIEAYGREIGLYSMWVESLS